LSRLPLPADNAMEYIHNSQPKDYHTHTFDNICRQTTIAGDTALLKNLCMHQQKVKLEGKVSCLLYKRLAI